MPRISFSYFVEDKLDPVTGRVIGHIMRPYIPIRLSIHHANPTYPVNALVDSGSDRNLFPKRWGEILGINFKKIRDIYISRFEIAQAMWNPFLAKEIKQTCELVVLKEKV